MCFSGRILQLVYLFTNIIFEGYFTCLQKTLLLKAVFRTYWPDYADFTLYAFFENLLFFFQPFVLR